MNYGLELKYKKSAKPPVIFSVSAEKHPVIVHLYVPIYLMLNLTGLELLPPNTCCIKAISDRTRCVPHSLLADLECKDSKRYPDALLSLTASRSTLAPHNT